MRNSLGERTDGEPRYLPTPAEIRAACAEIRATWSEQEHRQRAGALRRDWTPPGANRGQNVLGREVD